MSPPRTVVAGNPARIIGNFDDFHEKRKKESMGIVTPNDEILWKSFYEKKEERDRKH